MINNIWQNISQTDLLLCFSLLLMFVLIMLDLAWYPCYMKCVVYYECNFDMNTSISSPQFTKTLFCTLLSGVHTYVHAGVHRHHFRFRKVMNTSAALSRACSPALMVFVQSEVGFVIHPLVMRVETEHSFGMVTTDCHESCLRPL